MTVIFSPWTMCEAESLDWRWSFPELSPRELALQFTEEKKYLSFGASVYRLLKANDLFDIGNEESPCWFRMWIGSCRR